MQDFINKYAEVLNQVIDLMDFYQDPVLEMEMGDETETLLDPLLFMVQYFVDEQVEFSDVAFTEKVYTERLPKEMPFPPAELVNFKQILLDFYFALYQHNNLSLEDYQKITLMLAEKQLLFFKRMTDPDYWSTEKKQEMAEEALFDDLVSDFFSEIVHDTFNFEEKTDRHPHLRLLDSNHSQSSKLIDSKDTFNEYAIDRGTTDSNVSAYQIRIDLEGFRPPIWRRLLIPSGISYYKLHQIIQIAFEWEDCHLHEFQAGDLHFVSESTEEDFLPFFGGMFEELTEDELIDQEFQNRKTLTYVYDFGDDWTHKITIEKIIDQSELPKPVTPICIKAVRDVPEEDSGPNPTWKALDQEMINDQLEDLK